MIQIKHFKSESHLTVQNDLNAFLASIPDKKIIKVNINYVDARIDPFFTGSVIYIEEERTRPVRRFGNLPSKSGEIDSDYGSI